VFDRIDTLLGVGAGALAARQLIRRLKDRISRGRSVVSEHYGDWRQRQGDPATLARFLSQTSRSTAQVARLLGCTEPEAEAVLWAFGLSHDEDSDLWYPAAGEEAKLLQGNLELIIHAYDEGYLATRFRDRVIRLIETGETPPVVWPGEREDDPTPENETGADVGA
jgi:hypothetical protein